MATPSTVIFHNGTVILPDRTLANGVVVCRGERIRAVGRRGRTAMPPDATLVDARKGFISPGFVEIHTHGGDGADFMDGTPEAVRTVNRAHARHGTTSILPTTTVGSRAQIEALLDASKTVRDEWRINDGARVRGVHLYGPYFAKEKLGAHPLHGYRAPKPAEFRSFFDAGMIRVATCAAELPGAEAFYREARRRGYLVTCGHSNASWTEMERGYRAGMRHVDHFWCAMSSIQSLIERFGTPMQGSMEQFVLAREEMSTEVIADGYHLAPELLDFAFVQKGPKRLCLVTDSNRAMDMPPGRYRIGPRTNGRLFQSNGKVGLIGGMLASSIQGMDVMVRNMKKLTRATVAEAVRMASLTPAERAGIARDVGSLEPGKQADVLVLDQELRVQRVFLAGQEFSKT